MRNAFGHLIIDPDRLTTAERVDVLRALSGALQAANDRESQWLGQKLGCWLQRGGDLAALLGVRPERGSHRTPQSYVRADQVASLMVRLSLAVGTDRRACRILRGKEQATGLARELADQLNALKAPASPAAFCRARARVSRDR